MLGLPLSLALLSFSLSVSFLSIFRPASSTFLVHSKKTRLLTTSKILWTDPNYPPTTQTDSFFPHWEDSLGEGNLEWNLVSLPLIQYPPLGLWPVVGWVGWVLVWVGEKWQIIVCEAGIQDPHCYNLGIVGWGGMRKRGKGSAPRKQLRWRGDG